MGLPWLGPEKVFLNKGSQQGQKRCIQIGFASTVFHKGVILLIL